MRIAPCTITEARTVVAQLHRHLPVPPKGGRFALAVVDDEEVIHAVALVGHGARLGNDRYSATITRVASDGTPNACSQLYAACARVWRAMGGRVLYTFTLEGELGTSLKAAGWIQDGVSPARDWDRPKRHRTRVPDPVDKYRWTRRMTS